MTAGQTQLPCRQKRAVGDCLHDHALGNCIYSLGRSAVLAAKDVVPDVLSLHKNKNKKEVMPVAGLSNSAAQSWLPSNVAIVHVVTDAHTQPNKAWQPSRLGGTSAVMMTRKLERPPERDVIHQSCDSTIM